MNKELIKKWVAELRSGKYKQGKGLLRHNGRYCCLGVLGDVLVKQDPKSYCWGSESKYVGRQFISPNHSDDAFLSTKLLRDNLQELLSSLNDHLDENGNHDPISFSAIATAIEYLFDENFDTEPMSTVCSQETGLPF